MKKRRGEKARSERGQERGQANKINVGGDDSTKNRADNITQEERDIGQQIRDKVGNKTMAREED